MRFPGGTRLTTDHNSDSNTIEKHLQVFVRDNNVEQALEALKRKMQREGVFREMRRRKAYEKPSERRTREKAEAIRRVRKAARKQAQRDGLIPMPKRREDAAVLLPGFLALAPRKSGGRLDLLKRQPKGVAMGSSPMRFEGVLNT